MGQLQLHGGLTFSPCLCTTARIPVLFPTLPITWDHLFLSYTLHWCRSLTGPLLKKTPSGLSSRTFSAG